MNKNIFNLYEKINNNSEEALIIAEIGVNHNGSLHLAKKLIRSAKKIGANIVKFQTFKAKSLALENTPKVSYQKKSTQKNETHFEMLKKLELSYENHKHLFNYCKKLEIEFLSTPYDLKSAKFLNKLGVNYFKTSSADIVDLQLHKYIASTKKVSLVSVGMASIEEIAIVVNIYKKYGNKNLILLHTTSNYPASDGSINIRVIDTLRKTFKVPVGFSDHSKGYLAAVCAISLGARVIERHFTLNNNMDGPDHKASLNEKNFLKYIKEIRKSEILLGSKEKVIQEEEKEMALVSRKSLTLTKNLKTGIRIKKNDIESKRPGVGISPLLFNEVIGKKLVKSCKKGYQLKWEDLVE